MNFFVSDPILLQNQESWSYNGILMITSLPNSCQYFSMMWMFLLMETHGSHNSSPLIRSFPWNRKTSPGSALIVSFYFPIMWQKSWMEKKNNSKQNSKPFWARKLKQPHLNWKLQELNKKIGYILHKEWTRLHCLAFSLCL